MKELRYLSLALLVLLVTACEKKKSEQTAIPVENTTEIFTPKDIQIQKEKRMREEETRFSQKAQSKQDLTKEQKPSSQPSAVTQKQPEPQSATFTIKDINGKSYKIIHTDGGMQIDQMQQKDLLITIFSSWCPPCKGQLPYIQDIQNKHAATLFTLGVLVNDAVESDSLHHFLDRYNVRFPVTRDEALANKIIQELDLPQNYPLPLTVLYHNGKYRIHYEGATPPEMIEHDIATLKDH